MKKHILVLGLLAAVAVPASAKGLYVFGDVGRSNYNADLLYWDVDLSANSFAFGAGYSVNDAFSFEAGYNHIGNYTVDKQSDLTINSSALEISGVAKYPVNAQINIYGRLGFGKLTSEVAYYDSESTYKAFAGIGAGYKLSDNVSLRAEYDRYEEWNKANISKASVGIVYSF
jgi:OOP family OmpA-OmpF porin